MDPLYDVAIIGGGPAGSTAATFLARKGHNAILFEKDRLPRFKIGESLLPYSMSAFERLGIRQKLDAQFMPKFGAEISTVGSAKSSRVYFSNGLRARHDQSYQVTRAEFDKLLLDNATANGAKVLQEATVEQLEFGPDEVGLKVKLGNDSRQYRARYLLDCSGRSTLVGNYFKLKRGYDNLKKFSLFAHYENVTRDDGKEGTFIRLIRDHDRWFWMIPLSPTRMSIGVVMDSSTFKSLKRSPVAVMEESLRAQPLIWERMTHASRATEVYSIGDYSYRNESLAGDRWLLAGDAAGFIDPIFSTGVFLAIRSGEDAANVLDVALREPAKRARAFNRYSRDLRRVMDLYLRFVNNWYKPQFGEVIVHPVERFRIPAAVNAVLSGNLSNDFSICWRLQLFYLVVFLQNYLPLCPRIPKPPMPQSEMPSGQPTTANLYSSTD